MRGLRPENWEPSPFYREHWKAISRSLEAASKEGRILDECWFCLAPVIPYIEPLVRYCDTCDDYLTNQIEDEYRVSRSALPGG